MKIACGKKSIDSAGLLMLLLFSQARKAAILMENSGYVLMEDGSRISMEVQP